MCTCSREVFERRRAAFFDAMTKAAPAADGQGGDAVAVLPSAPVYTRNNDVDHEYRQESDFYFLTGFSEPESVLVMDAKDRKVTLFVRPRDPNREVWDGPRAGVEGAKSDLGANEAFVIADLDAELPKLMQNHRRLYYRLGTDRVFDARLIGIVDRLRTRARLGITAPVEVVDPGTIVHEMRLYKQREELDIMREAAKITREGHLLAMSRTQPSMHEYEVEALLLDTFRRHGSERVAYGSIVGSGPNACVLHYRANNRKMNEGELLLIDAGCEYGYYASDVTRTFPVSGKFTHEQQAIYELVLEAQVAGIEATRVGATLEGIHKQSIEIITRGLARLGLLRGEVEKLIETEAYKPFFMHRTSHWLGMDVHDVGAYFVGGKPRALEPGMVLTVEPGIYIAKDNEHVPPEWRGIGVRIEDDVLVTAEGPENLTAAIPKSVQEVQQACAA
jgi:Xaa-Pro aminopeptidase